jgi:hypothetical protein
VTEPGIDVAVLIERITQLEKRMEERFDAADKAVAAAFASAEKAVAKAEARLDGTLIGFPQEYARRLEIDIIRNELGELKNSQGALVTRGELKAAADNLSDLINRNREDVEQLAKKLS